MKKNIYGDCYLKKTYVINELNGEMFKLGKWEKDVICGLMDVDFGPSASRISGDSRAKLDKIIALLNNADDKKRLEVGEVVPSWYINYCWDTCFESVQEIESIPDYDDRPCPIRAVQCRTLKTLQEKGLIKVESLGLVNRKFYGLTPEGLRIADKLTN